MARDDYITAHLTRLHEACLFPRRQRRTRRHWANYPPLAARSLTEAEAVIADAYHPDHNAVAAALLAAHRDRPGQPTDAEMVLLLIAARPFVLRLDRGDRYHDSRAALWSSVARRLAGLDPDAIATSPVPFLVALGGRIRPDAAKHRSEPARNETRCFPAEDRELEVYLARQPAADHDVANVAIARLYLAAARADRDWYVLARYASLGRTRSRFHPSRVARHRRRLATDIGYVA